MSPDFWGVIRPPSAPGGLAGAIRQPYVVECRSCGEQTTTFAGSPIAAVTNFVNGGWSDDVRCPTCRDIRRTLERKL